MSRPAKNIKVKSGALKNGIKESRSKIETDLKGSKDKIKPESYLNDRQKEIFWFIVDELEGQDILGNLDNFVLNQTSIVIEKLEQVSKKINEVPLEEIGALKDIRYVQEQYFKQFVKYCNELCLSPQARAKISISLTPKEKKGLADILGDDDE